jgi:tetratricopeptide (TPR) repeat protein
VESEIDRLRKKVENFPSPSSYNRLAELLHLAKQEGDAETVCRKCIKEFPRNAQVHVLLADILLSTGRRPDAMESLRSALERDGRNYAAARMYADLLAENRDLAGALAQLKQVLVYRPADAAVSKRIAELEGLNKGVPAGAMPTSRPASPAAAPAAASGVRPAATVSGVRPAAAGSGVTPGTRAATPGSGIRRSAYETLAIEAGVRAALIVDPTGQVVMARSGAGLSSKEEALAALSAAIRGAATEVARLSGAPAPSAWVLCAEQGQVLSFHRDNGFSVVALAEPTVRPAMLELRARQALIDLGTT